MIVVTGNLWTYPTDFRIITTNGAVRSDGRAVMGRGCAKEAAARYPALPRLLGEKLRVFGNHVHFFSDDTIGDRIGLFTFPVKHRWNERADLDLIARSVEELRATLLVSATYLLPRPGCGNGSLRWEAVQPIVATLPDNVLVIDFGGSQ